MINNYKILFPPEIYFGPGELAKLPGLIKRFGKRVILVTGSASLKAGPQWERLLFSLKKEDITYKEAAIQTEPSPELINSLKETIKHENPDVIAAIGGGSVLDTGKALSAMFHCSYPVEDYLEGVGDRTHDGTKLPFIAVPTTSGTGSEATKNAVLSRRGPEGFKKSLRHDNFIPNITLIDPVLTLSCPGKITAYCGMDAFTQLLESYVSTGANRLTDSLAYEGLRCIKEALIPACEDKSEDLEVRSKVSYAALVSGITLANAGLGTVHGFASSIGGLFDIPHGCICGTLMGETNRVSIEKMIAEDKNNPALAKFARIGRLFTGKEQENSETKEDSYYCRSLLEIIDEWTNRLQIPGLGTFGITPGDLELIAGQTGNKNNPVKLEKETLMDILSNRL